MKMPLGKNKGNRSKFHSDSDVSTEVTDDSQKLSVEESSSADSSERSISPASLSPSPYALLQKELEETEEAFQKLQQKYLLSESKNEELGRELYDKGRELLHYQSANRENIVEFDARIKEMREEIQRKDNELEKLKQDLLEKESFYEAREHFPSNKWTPPPLENPKTTEDFSTQAYFDEPLIIENEELKHEIAKLSDELEQLSLKLSQTQQQETPPNTSTPSSPEDTPVELGVRQINNYSFDPSFAREPYPFNLEVDSEQITILQNENQSLKNQIEALQDEQKERNRIEKEKYAHELEIAKSAFKSISETQQEVIASLSTELHESIQQTKALIVDSKLNEESLIRRNFELEEQQERLSISENMVTQLKRELTTLTTSSNEKITALQSKLTSSEQKSKHLTDEINGLKTKLTKLVGEQKNKDAEIKTLEKDLQSKESQVEHLTSKLATSKADRTRSQKKMSQLKKQLESLQKKHAINEGTIHQLTTQLASITKEKDELEDRLGDVRIEKFSLEMHLNEKIDEQQETISALGQKLKANDQEIRSLKSENQKLNSSLISRDKRAIGQICEELYRIIQNVKLLILHRPLTQKAIDQYRQQLQVLGEELKTLPCTETDNDYFNYCMDNFNDLVQNPIVRSEVGTMTEQPTSTVTAAPSPNPTPAPARPAAPPKPAVAQTAPFFSSQHKIFASLEKINIDDMLSSLKSTQTKVVINVPETKLTDEIFTQLKSDGLTVHSPSGHEYHLQANETDCKALLTDAQATKVDKESDEEHKTRLAITMINMIDNVLAKSERISIKTSDPFMAEIARSYLQSLQNSKKIKPEWCEISGKEGSDLDKNAAQKVFAALDIDSSHHDKNPAMTARQEMIRLREEEKKHEADKADKADDRPSPSPEP